ncbi:uncharacterized protein GIQ15_06133 [Arthroderma uncinatum]|uniref:uncharacterized protein n=1 Tax=Arthroderma uncinatum TaxID=74035 RepID=UPI00144AD4E6|nr:uncharacterized protein GIQ15_06133 [Arthroderma uncinatum]KAF3480786.1 hypothetical protein GIQ15_06133 [Arthroderma uncinatum]
MTVPSATDRAKFETTKRLLAQIINEGLASATVEESVVEPTQQRQRQLCIQNSSNNADSEWVKVNLKLNAFVDVDHDGKVRSLVLPESLEPPVITKRLKQGGVKEVLSPDEIFRFVIPWFVGAVGDTVSIDQIASQFRNSAEHQEAPLKPINGVDLPSMLMPDLAFVSVPRADMQVVGPFEQTIEPLLKTLEVVDETISTAAAADNERIIVPCFARQLPAIFLHFPNAVFTKSVEKCADAQASMRTVTVHPDLKFDYHLKLSLGCQLTSGLRLIGPWVASAGPIFSELLDKLLPPDLWLYKEIASATGAQAEYIKGGQLSCILREDLEPRARSNNQALIMSGALAQRPLYRDNRSYAEILFALETEEEKKSWFARYLACAFKIILTPLVRHGIGMEAHSQNLVARVCLRTKQVIGFAIRDFGGVKLHMPTLESQGFGIDPSRLARDGTAMTDKLEDVWSKVHHALLQNHIGNLISAMGLDTNGVGWEIVREELATSLLNDEHSGTAGREIYEYFMRETMPFKCFLKMKMEGKYRDCIDRDLPNVVLSK